MCRCAHTSLGLGRGEYPSNPPSAPTSPHGQPEAATDVKEAGEETGREFCSMYKYQKQLDDRENRKLAGGKGNTETTTKQGAGIAHRQTLPPFNHPAFQCWQD